LGILWKKRIEYLNVKRILSRFWLNGEGGKFKSLEVQKASSLHIKR
jgi:hypothetical protein